MTARIDPAAPPFPAAVQQTLDSVMPEGVAPLRLFTTLANDQRLFGKFMSGGLLDKGNLTLRQREILINRTLARCGSDYEWGVHIALFAKRAELTSAQVHSLAHGDHNDRCWIEQEERLLIRLCDELHDDCTVSDCLWTDLSASFPDTAMMEMLMLAGFYRTVSYLTNAIKLPPEPFAADFPDKI